MLADFDPKVASEHRNSKYVFLANAVPVIQARALDQIEGPAFTVVDTMNLWIDGAKDDLLALLRRVDAIVLNDEEARMLTGESNLIRAASAVLGMGEPPERLQILVVDRLFLLEDMMDVVGMGEKEGVGRIEFEVNDIAKTGPALQQETDRVSPERAQMPERKSRRRHGWVLARRGFDREVGGRHHFLSFWSNDVVSPDEPPISLDARKDGQ